MYAIGCRDGSFLKVETSPAFGLRSVARLDWATMFLNVSDVQIFCRLINTTNAQVYVVEYQQDGEYYPSLCIVGTLDLAQINR